MKEPIAKNNEQQYANPSMDPQDPMHPASWRNRMLEAAAEAGWRMLVSMMARDPAKIAAEFHAALGVFGMRIRGPVSPDGRLHRFYVDGERKDTRNGWYALFPDGPPFAVFGHLKSGFKGTWRLKHRTMLTVAERAEIKRRMQAVREARKAEERAEKRASRRKYRRTMGSDSGKEHAT